MEITRKICVFLSLPFHKKWLFFEAFIMLAWARMLKIIPFSKVAPTLGEQMQETSMTQLENKDYCNEIKNQSVGLYCNQIWDYFNEHYNRTRA